MSNTVTLAKQKSKTNCLFIFCHGRNGLLGGVNKDYAQAGSVEVKGAGSGISKIYQGGDDGRFIGEVRWSYRLESKGMLAGVEILDSKGFLVANEILITSKDRDRWVY